METESEFKARLRQISDWLNEQVWFQQLKAKWESLDAEQQTYIRYGAIAGSILVVISILVSVVSSTYGLRNEVRTKRELLGLIQQANDEIRSLQAAGAAAAGDGKNLKDVDWKGVFMAQAGSAGIAGESITVSGAKKGPETNNAKEFLFDIDVKHVNIKQLVRFVFNLENGGRPIKVRRMTVDTTGGEGWLDAALALSTFEIQESK